MEPVLISVIIPTYNNGKDISNPLVSIDNQLQPEDCKVSFEIIIIDDGSSKEKFAEVQVLASKRKDVTLLRCDKNGGPSVARNTGLKIAKGELITFLDSDDLWPENKIQILMPLFNNSEFEVAGGKVKYVIADGVNSDIERWEDEEKRITHVHLGALLIRRAIFDRGYYFDEGLRYSEDVDWWLRIREDNINICIIEETTLLYQIHGENMTFNKNIHEFGLLNVLNKSLKRRKEKNSNPQLAQIRDFRMKRKDLLISVIIPMYNGINSIERAIQSILNQTYKNIEIILVDDGSTDGGANLVKNIFPKVTVIQQKNKGVSAARNIGINESKGDLLAFLDHDDVWLPEKLEKQLTLLKGDPYLGWVTCNQQIYWEKNIERPNLLKSGHEKPHRSLVPSSFLIRKHILVSMNGFNESLKMGEDMDLIRKLRNSKIKESNVDEILLEKWYNGKNMTFNIEQAKADMFAVLRKQIKNK